MPKYISKLQGKRVLVLGGTSGIGYCVAEAALEYGAIVVISGSRQPKIDATIERLMKSVPGGKVSGHPCDLANPATTEDNVKALLEFATKDGKLDHIAMTAGDALALPKVADITVEKFQAGQQVRFMGALLLAKLIPSFMNISNSSSFTVTGGVNTHKPNFGWSLAAAVGASIEGLTRGLAKDLKPVRVNCVAPGAILTELWTASFTNPEDLENLKKQYSEKLLTGELGAPEDTAEAYLYVMKDKFVDGQTLLTEGGYMLL